VASQVYEGLFKFDPATLEVVPGLVAEYAVDKSRTQYTFKLKQGVYFHDDACFEGGKGREVTAEDVKYCFTQLCTQSATNQNFSLLNTLKGAESYYAASANGKQTAVDVAGVKVVDKYTVQLHLKSPPPFCSITWPALVLSFIPARLSRSTAPRCGSKR
jgi:peptide/nickel transport system substrate-binding protein